MVRRSQPAESTKKKSGKQKVGVQRRGELQLDNPTIPADLDEDIDDDLAFNSDDEELYGHFFNKSSGPSSTKKSNKAKRSGAMDDDDDEYAHLAALSSASEKVKGKRKKGNSDEDDLLNYHEDGQSSGDDGEYMDLSDMLDLSLAKDKKKSKSAKKDVDKLTKKRRGKVVESEPETLYTMGEAEKKSFASALNHLSANGREEAAAVKKRLEEAMEKKHTVVAVDMEDSAKDRLERKEVRKLVDQNMVKYKPLLRQLNNTKHLQFPMTAPESVPNPTSLGGIVAAAEAQQLLKKDDSKPQSSSERLASKLNSLLTTAGLTKARTQTAASHDSFGEYVEFDQQEGNGEGNEEAPNSSYMAKLKSMLAFENSRRKRFNKIKSKTYRRILRKEKDREKERRQKAFELLHPELARQRLAEKLMKARAEERVTQKHKNTSAWVKHAKRFAEFDANAKDAINEQNALHQKLMQKMDQEAGEENYDNYAADEDGRSEASSEEDRVVDALFDAASGKKGSADATSLLWKKADETNNDGSPISKARAALRDMDFMKNARAREEKDYQEQMAALTQDIQRYQDGKEIDEPEVVSATTRKGRKKFAAKSKGDVEEVEAITLKTQKGLSADAGQSSAVENWDDDDDDDGVQATEFAGDRKPQKVPTKHASTRIQVLPTASKRVREEEEDVAAPSKAPEQTMGLEEQQAYLISRAFAQDDVDEDFLKEKESQVEMIMKPTDRNETLPGWGEWGGEDESLNQRHQEKVAHSAVQKQIERSFLMKSRADATLDHVIINHDGVELVPDRMTLHMVPRPFSNPQEFARSLRQPVGPEWSSALTFKDAVQPRVEVRQGRSVVPLDISLRKKMAKTKRRKVEKSSAQ